MWLVQQAIIAGMVALRLIWVAPALAYYNFSVSLLILLRLMRKMDRSFDTKDNSACGKQGAAGQLA